MMTAEQNYRLLEEIDANRRFLLQAYLSNSALRAIAEKNAALKRGNWCETPAHRSAQGDACGGWPDSLPPGPAAVDGKKVP